MNVFEKPSASVTIGMILFLRQFNVNDLLYAHAPRCKTCRTQLLQLYFWNQTEFLSSGQLAKCTKVNDIENMGTTLSTDCCVIGSGINQLHFLKIGLKTLYRSTSMNDLM